MKRAVFVTLLAVSTTLVGAQNQKVQPTPRLSDGKPDLTGVYQASNRRGPEWDAQVPGEAPGQPAQSAQPTAGVNVAQREPIPFRPEALKRAQDILNRRSVDDPAAHCLPQASPRMTPVSLFPIEFVHTPKKLVILYEYFWSFRTIPIGATHPDDAEPTFLGDSVARWDGNTLVIEVTGHNDQTWFDRAGNNHTEALKVTERFTLQGENHIQYEATLEDPKTFSKPWQIRMPFYRRMEPNAQLLEYKCVEFSEELLYGDLKLVREILAKIRDLR